MYSCKAECYQQSGLWSELVASCLPNRSGRCYLLAVSFPGTPPSLYPNYSLTLQAAWTCFSSVGYSPRAGLYLRRISTISTRPREGLVCSQPRLTGSGCSTLSTLSQSSGTLLVSSAPTKQQQARLHRGHGSTQLGKNLLPRRKCFLPVLSLLFSECWFGVPS